MCVMDTKKKAALIIDSIFYIFFLAVIYIFLKYCISYILPFLISFGIIYSLQKPMILLSKKIKIPKNLLTVIFLVLMISLIVTSVYYAVASLIDFFSGFLTKNNGFTAEIVAFNNPENPINMLLRAVPEPIKNTLDISPEKMLSTGADYLAELISDFLKNLVSALPGFLVSCIVSVVSACFFAFKYDKMINFIKRQLSYKSVEVVKKVKRVINFSIFNYLKGYSILTLITFAEMLIGLFVLNVKNAFPLALIIAFVDLLPIFGTGTVLIPWGIVQIVMGNTFLGVGLLCLYAVSAILRYFLEPKIIGNKVGVEPIVSLFAMFVGLKLFGILGLILLPLTVSVLTVLHNNGLIRLWK